MEEAAFAENYNDIYEMIFILFYFIEHTRGAWPSD